MTRLTLSSKSYFIACFTLVGIHYFHVSLSGGNALVSHHTLNRADISSGSTLKGSKCSAVGVEGDMFGDAC